MSSLRKWTHFFVPPYTCNCTLYFMRLTEETLRQQYLEQKKALHWETDLELHSKFLDRKVLLKVTISTLTNLFISEIS